jgi:IS30 family transposase
MMMKKLERGKNAKQLIKLMVRMFTTYIKYVHSITGDNDSEFADHETIVEFTEQQIKQIQYKINSKPRKNLNFYSSKEVFFLNLHNLSCIH